jgi:cytochrome P450
MCLDNSVNAQFHFAWMAFGAGQHHCIGRDFALLEPQLLLAMLVQRYRIAATGHIATPKLTAMLQPKDGVWVTLNLPQPCNISAVPETLG